MASYGTAVVTEDNCEVGGRVARGPDWHWGDQEGNGPGTIEQCSGQVTTDWAVVDWDAGVFLPATFRFVPTDVMRSIRGGDRGVLLTTRLASFFSGTHKRRLYLLGL